MSALFSPVGDPELAKADAESYFSDSKSEQPIDPLPVPSPFIGYIYKRSRYIQTFRMRYIEISLKHAKLSTYTNKSKVQCTESVNLKFYDIAKVTDTATIAALKGDLKTWDEFALVPHKPDAHPTFLFVSSCFGCWDSAEKGKFVKNAVLCAMSYRLARSAVIDENYKEAKQHLLLFARNKWTLDRAQKAHSLKQRLTEFEKWIGAALALPFDTAKASEAEQQCAVLRCWAYFVMNVFGDRCARLGRIYERILKINASDGVTLTFYG